MFLKGIFLFSVQFADPLTHRGPIGALEAQQVLLVRADDDFKPLQILEHFTFEVMVRHGFVLVMREKEMSELPIRNIKSERERIQTNVDLVNLIIYSKRKDFASSIDNEY